MTIILSLSHSFTHNCFVLRLMFVPLSNSPFPPINHKNCLLYNVQLRIEMTSRKMLLAKFFCARFIYISINILFSISFFIILVSAFSTEQMNRQNTPVCTTYIHHGIAYTLAVSKSVHLFISCLKIWCC